MDTSLEMPQHERLTKVLNIYRATMRRHIVSELRQAWGPNWFEELRSRLPEQQQRELQANQRTMDLHRSNGILRISAGDEQLTLLDIPLFLFIVRHQEHIFGTLTEQENLEKLIRLYEYRNVWAHPGATDVAANALWQAAQLAEEILQIFDGEAAAAVREAATAPLRPVETMDQQAADQELAEPYLEKPTYDAVLATFETVTRIEAEIGAISKATERQEVETRAGLWRDLSELIQRQHGELQTAADAAAYRAEQRLVSLAETSGRVEEEVHELQAHADRLTERLASLEHAYSQIRDALQEVNATLGTARTHAAIVWAKCERDIRAVYVRVAAYLSGPG